MKFNLVSATAAVAAILFLQSPAFAGQQDFEIVNKTGYAIKHVHVSENDNNNWDEDILGRDMLEDGESVEISFAKGEKNCKWDMKVIYDDGDSAVWQDLNLCKISKLTLRWNKNSGETTAVID